MTLMFQITLGHTVKGHCKEGMLEQYCLPFAMSSINNTSKRDCIAKPMILIQWKLFLIFYIIIFIYILLLPVWLYNNLYLVYIGFFLITLKSNTQSLVKRNQFIYHPSGNVIFPLGCYQILEEIDPSYKHLKLVMEPNTFIK